VGNELRRSENFDVTNEHEDCGQDDYQDERECHDEYRGLHLACGAAGGIFFRFGGRHGAIVAHSIPEGATRARGWYNQRRSSAAFGSAGSENAKNSRRLRMKKWMMVAALAATLGSSVAIAQTTKWQLDPMHSNAQFVVRHMGISNVQGEFTKLSGTVELDDADVSKSSVSATIDLSSVDTRVAGRDNDLKSANFFDVAKYPTMTFQSTKIWKTGEGTAKMTGNLTLHGVTKEVTFDVTGPTKPAQFMGGTHRGASATTKINRQDFGLKYMTGMLPGGDEMIGDTVTITLDVELVPQK
jgi:polyisoprenoid-binding protein YceI